MDPFDHKSIMAQFLRGLVSPHDFQTHLERLGRASLPCSTQCGDILYALRSDYPLAGYPRLAFVSGRMTVESIESWTTTFTYAVHGSFQPFHAPGDLETEIFGEWIPPPHLPPSTDRVKIRLICRGPDIIQGSQLYFEGRISGYSVGPLLTNHPDARDYVITIEAYSVQSVSSRLTNEPGIPEIWLPPPAPPKRKKTARPSQGSSGTPP